MTRRPPLPHSTFRGFTLLEVLVAMAILSLGMIAVFGAMSQSLDATVRLRDKTLAHWVAINQITELQITGEYPGAGKRRDQVDMANEEWIYDMTIADVAQIDMRRIDIAVSRADAPDDILATVIGFVGPRRVPPAEGVDRGFGSGWEPPQETYGEAG